MGVHLRRHVQAMIVVGSIAQMVEQRDSKPYVHVQLVLLSLRKYICLGQMNFNGGDDYQ